MRIVLKVSGESLKDSNNLDNKKLNNVLEEIKSIKENNELIIVVGGGNFWRGRTGLDIESNTSDYIGMLGTVMNALALTSFLNNNKIKAKCYSAFEIENIIKNEQIEEIEKDLKENNIIVLGGGCGVPGYSTDTTTVEKAIKYKVDKILMAKNIDGVYDKDPKEDGAKLIKEMTHHELLEMSKKQGEKALKILDMKALELLDETKIDLYIYKAGSGKEINKILNNEIGTRITK